MKYVITDQNEAKIGKDIYLHSELTKELKGKVIKAGHCRITEDFSYHVWGESIGYGIQSRPEDADILNKLLPYNPPLEPSEQEKA